MESARDHRTAAFRLELLHLDGAVEVGLIGELDVTTVDVLDRELAPLVAGHHAGSVVLDCNRLRFIDGHGLGALLRVVRGLPPHGMPLLRGPAKTFCTMLEVAGAAREFRVEARVEAVAEEASQFR